MTDEADAGAEAPAFAIEYFEEGALILCTADARMVQVNPAGADILRLFEAGCAEDAAAALLCYRCNLRAEEAAESVAALRRQLEASGLRLEELLSRAVSGTRPERRPPG
jgi:hypothetical protein